MGMASQTPKPI